MVSHEPYVSKIHKRLGILSVLSDSKLWRPTECHYPSASGADPPRADWGCRCPDGSAESITGWALAGAVDVGGVVGCSPLPVSFWTVEHCSTNTAHRVFRRPAAPRSKLLESYASKNRIQLSKILDLP